MSLLVLNAGSSTLKFILFDSSVAGSSMDAKALQANVELASGLIDWKTDRTQAAVSFRSASGERLVHQAAVPDYRAAVRAALDLLAPLTQMDAIQAAGHRVVHGGEHFRQSVLIGDNVKQAISDLAQLAPLHNPPALQTIEAAQAALPAVPHVAVFDTTFFQTLTRDRFLYPVPYDWYERWGIRRFGFHGISHQYCSMRAAELLPGVSQPRLVICHLGNGCSASAVRGGLAVDCTMGFTPLEGLMMGTRSGSVDPGMLLYLLKKGELDATRMERALNYESGLLGVSGVASDFRQVAALAQEGNERAGLALTMFANRIRGAVGSLAAALGGLDALVFTAGIGEHSAWLREQVCRGLEFMGVHLDEQKNRDARPDADVATTASVVRVLALHTREELLIAQETQRVVGRPRPSANEAAKPPSELR